MSRYSPATSVKRFERKYRFHMSEKKMKHKVKCYKRDSLKVQKMDFHIEEEMSAAALIVEPLLERKRRDSRDVSQRASGQQSRDYSCLQQSMQESRQQSRRMSSEQNRIASEQCQSRKVSLYQKRSCSNLLLLEKYSSSTQSAETSRRYRPWIEESRPVLRKDSYHVFKEDNQGSSGCRTAPEEDRDSIQDNSHAIKQDTRSVSIQECQDVCHDLSIQSKGHVSIVENGSVIVLDGAGEAQIVPENNATKEKAMDEEDFRLEANEPRTEDRAMGDVDTGQEKSQSTTGIGEKKEEDMSMVGKDEAWVWSNEYTNLDDEIPAVRPSKVERKNALSDIWAPLHYLFKFLNVNSVKG